MPRRVQLAVLSTIALAREVVNGVRFGRDAPRFAQRIWVDPAALTTTLGPMDFDLGRVSSGSVRGGDWDLAAWAIDESVVQAWVQVLANRVAAAAPASERYTFHVHEDREHQVFLPRISLVAHGVPYTYLMNRDFLGGVDYRNLTQMAKTLTGLIGDGAEIVRGDRRAPVSSLAEAIDWLLAESRRGVYIQRYKGLGEMNPEQLWETTMNPDVRRMLKVTIEDAIAADRIFNTLMGDEVEPRREFIETNALRVANLDI